MKVTIVNRSTDPVPGPGATSIAAGGLLMLENRLQSEVASLISTYVSDLVQVHVEFEAADLTPLISKIKTPSDPAADATTLAACGFDIEDLYGNAFSTTDKMYLGAFDDAACTIPSTTATLDTAATGTINAGAGTNTLEVTPDAGVLSVTLTIPSAADQVVYLKAWVYSSERALDTSEVHTATFSVS